MNCPHRLDVAVYLLDVLEQPETERMREHLPECPACRREYDELRGLPALLSTLTPVDVEDIVSPSELPQQWCESLIPRAATHPPQRGRHRLLGVAAAATVLIAGIATGTAVFSRPQPATGSSTASATETVSATDPQTHVHASLTLASRSWGTQIRLRLSGVAPAQRCVLVASTADHRRDTAAAWVADYRGAADVTGTTVIPVEQIRHLDIITASGRRLVSLPPATSSH